jgi:hypothetical protein
MGDRWDQNELNDSRYVWLPITIDEARVASLEWHDVWKVDVKTGACDQLLRRGTKADMGNMF